MRHKGAKRFLTHTLLRVGGILCLLKCVKIPFHSLGVGGRTTFFSRWDIHKLIRCHPNLIRSFSKYKECLGKLVPNVDV
jgi:hypothetical protein